tara:strand:- start:138 stop:437 length:300 start_codon:yes stop_codon:yes gene_type:complete
MNVQSSSTDFGCITLFRGTVSGTNLGYGIGLAQGFTGMRNSTGMSYYNQGLNISYLDSPSTTSAQVYTLAMRSADNSSSVGVNNGAQRSTFIAMEIDGT